MFLGQPATFSRSGFTLSGFSGEVGALHLNQTGYTACTVAGTEFELHDGYNLLVFGNRSGSLTLSFEGTGTIVWSDLRAYFEEITLESEANRETPYRFTPNEQIVGDESSFSTLGKIVGSFAFEWRRLSWEKVRILRKIDARITDATVVDPSVILIPDGREADRHNCVITSPFDFYQTLDFDFNQGASGVLVFETV